MHHRRSVHERLVLRASSYGRRAVGLAPGAAFGPGGERFMRLCFAVSHATLRTGVERLVTTLDR